MKKISVAIATYNGSKYIEEQIESILKQSVLPSEIVISDDMSRDDTLKIAKNALRSFPGHVYMSRNSKTLGYKKNFMKAYNKCSGDMVFFCDQDDIWHVKKIELITAACDNETLVVTHNFKVIDELGGVIIGDYYKLLVDSGKRRQDSAKGCALMVNKSKLPNKFPVNYSGQAHDILFLKCAVLSKSIKHVDDVLMSHRLHGSNTSGRISKKAGVLQSFIRSLKFKILFSGSDIEYCLNSISDKDYMFYLNQLQLLAARKFQCGRAIELLSARVNKK